MGGKRSYEYYLKRFNEGVAASDIVEVEKPESVSRNNHGIDTYRRAAKAIGLYYPEKIDDFSLALNDDNKHKRLACAVCMMELMKTDMSYQEKALRAINDIAMNGDFFERYVWALWLRRWNNSHAKDEMVAPD